LMTTQAESTVFTGFTKNKRNRIYKKSL